MRVNQPVTQREFDFPEGVTLMSTTDVQSHLAYANDAFVSVSGFSREELQGQPHNIVRHPDMPPEAFADMWATLKNGEPWTALVKNRRKNGDHYWVRANAVPVIRQGRHVGYMSVRTKPSRDEIAGAEQLYRDFREGRATGLAFHRGLIVRTGWKAWTNAWKTMSVRSRIRLAMLASVPAATACAWAAGLGGWGLGGFALGATAISGAVCGFLESQIARPMELLRTEALRVATGESQQVASMDRVDEVGMTLRSIGQLGLMFRWLLADVSQQALSVKNAATEIAQGNSDLSGRTEQAAASVQETAASMEEMTATIKANAETATQAEQLSGTASHAATQGGKAVSEVVSTMAEITESSKRIADITGVIDSIAFQTNILALNAAVEAARAGEQGRGFAVVAAEVRTLAQRSAEAAREIKGLIAASVERVDSGSRLVDNAGQRMDEIVDQVQRVSVLIAEINSATREQSGGIAQVSQAIGHIDEITQQNAALVEQSTAASETLREQSSRLAEAVNVFR